MGSSHSDRGRKQGSKNYPNYTDHAEVKPVTLKALKTGKESKRRGGARPGAGRPRGAKSKLKVEIEAIAMGYANSALSVLNQIATKGGVESARVAAAIALLDRAGGKPRQALEVGGTGGGPLVVNVVYSHE